MSARKFVVGAALLTAGLAGGSVAAGDYPPASPPQSTVVSSSGIGETPVASQSSPGRLPDTGSDAGTIAMIAAGAVVTGAGLLTVTRRRRHPAATS